MCAFGVLGLSCEAPAAPSPGNRCGGTVHSMVDSIRSEVLATFRSEPPSSPPPPGKTVDFGTNPQPRSLTIDLSIMSRTTRRLSFRF